MAKFDAATAVEAMDIDWSAYGGPVAVIPEPSNKAITRFQNDLRRAAALIGMSPGDKVDLETAATIDESAANEFVEAIKAAMVEIGGGAYTAEEFDNLPWRIQMAFIAWLNGELSPNPTAPGIKR